MIGLKTPDITYVAVSHTHGDHIGNVRLFSDSTVLMQRAEYNWISTPDGPNDNVNQLKALARNLLGAPKHLELLDRRYGRLWRWKRYLGFHPRAHTRQSITVGA